MAVPMRWLVVRYSTRSSASARRRRRRIGLQKVEALGTSDELVIRGLGPAAQEPLLAEFNNRGCGRSDRASAGPRDGGGGFPAPRPPRYPAASRWQYAA